MCDLLGIIIIVTCLFVRMSARLVLLIYHTHAYVCIYTNVNSSSIDLDLLGEWSLWNELHQKTMLVLFSKRLSEDSNSPCEPGQR